MLLISGMKYPAREDNLRGHLPEQPVTPTRHQGGCETRDAMNTPTPACNFLHLAMKTLPAYKGRCGSAQPHGLRIQQKQPRRNRRGWTRQRHGATISPMAERISRSLRPRYSPPVCWWSARSSTCPPPTGRPVGVVNFSAPVLKTTTDAAPQPVVSRFSVHGCRYWSVVADHLLPSTVSTPTLCYSTQSAGRTQ